MTATVLNFPTQEGHDMTEPTTETVQPDGKPAARQRAYPRKPAAKASSRAARKAPAKKAAPTKAAPRKAAAATKAAPKSVPPTKIRVTSTHLTLDDSCEAKDVLARIKAMTEVIAEARALVGAVSTARVATVQAAHAAGHSYGDLARAAGMTPARMTQIGSGRRAYIPKAEREEG